MNWQPSSRQWTVIWLVALLVVFGWPPESGRSLGVTAVRWLADPMHRLPEPPSPLPMGRDDDGDAVTEHDLLENAYYDARERSAVTRWRLDLAAADDPLPPSTERQLLVALAVVAALAVWRMEGHR